MVSIRRYRWGGETGGFAVFGLAGVGEQIRLALGQGQSGRA